MRVARCALKCLCYPGVADLRETIRSFQNSWKDFLQSFLTSWHRFQSRERFRRALKERRLMAKQTKITIETDSLLILRGRNSTRAWCPRCAAEGEMIALENTG